MTQERIRTYGILEASRMSGVSQKQLRSWEGKFIPMPQKIISGNYGYRRYMDDDIALIRRIKQYQDEGFTLKAASAKALKR
jgi:DNA-binding transcriptional MerR regulator